MKQRMIIKVPMTDQKSRSRALKTVVGVAGVESVALIGSEKDQLQVIGEGIDSVTLTRSLRKKVAHAQLLSLGEEKKVKAPTPQPRPPTPQPQQPVVGWYPPPPPPLPPPPSSYGVPYCQFDEVRDTVNEPICCTIM